MKEILGLVLVILQIVLALWALWDKIKSRPDKPKKERDNEL